MVRCSCSANCWKQFFSGHAVVPKKVSYHNWKIGLFLDFLRFLAFAFVVWNAWRFRAWYEVLTPAGYSGFWFERPENYESLAETERLQAPYCDKSLASRYDYKYSEKWDYSNNSCKGLPRHMQMLKQMTTSGMFLPTHWRETLTTVWRTSDVGSDGICESECAGVEANSIELRDYSDYVQSGSLNRGDCLCKIVASKNFFALGVEKKRIGFELSAVLEFANGDVETLRQKNVERNVLTILRDANTNAEIRRVLPGESFFVEVEELLKMGGYSLEDRLETHVNMLGKGFDDFPVLRITGMDMTLFFRFHNLADSNHLEGHHHDGPVCYVEVRITPKWSSLERVVEDPGDLFGTAHSARSRYMYGINIDINIAGGFSKFDFQGVFNTVASAFVYMQFPVLIVVFVAQHLLGPLSLIYSKAQTQRFLTVEALHGFFSRILVAKETYMLMLEKQKEVLPSEAEQLTEENFRSQLHAIIDADQRVEQLSKHEIASMINVAVNSINSKDDDYVAFGDYLKSHSNSESVTLSEIACLFDVDRNRGFLEHVFEPEFLSSARATVKLSRENSPMAMQLETSLGTGYQLKREASKSIDNSDSTNFLSAESKVINDAVVPVAAEAAAVDELREEVSRLKCSHEETIEKFNVAFDRMVAQIDQVVASRLEHLGDRLRAAFAEFQGQVRSQLKPVNGVENELDEVVSRLELMGYRLGSVVTEFQGVAASTKVPIDGFRNGFATSPKKVPPLGDTEKTIAALQLAQKGQNHIHGILEARVFALHKRVEKRFASIEHVFNTVFGRLEVDGARRRASAPQQPRETPKLDIGQLSDCTGGLVSDMNEFTEREVPRMRDLAQEVCLPERLEGVVADKSDANAFRVLDLSERVTKLEQELRKLENAMWSVREDVASFDYISIQAQAHLA